MTKSSLQLHQSSSILGECSYLFNNPLSKITCSHSPIFLALEITLKTLKGAP